MLTLGNPCEHNCTCLIASFPKTKKARLREPNVNKIAMKTVKNINYVVVGVVMGPLPKNSNDPCASEPTVPLMRQRFTVAFPFRV